MPLPSSGIILVEKPTGKQAACAERSQQQQQQYTSISQPHQQQPKTAKQKSQRRQQILSVPLTAPLVSLAPTLTHTEVNNARFRQQRGRGSKHFLQHTQTIASFQQQRQQHQYQDAILENFNKSNSSGSSNGAVALNTSTLKRQRQRIDSGTCSNYNTNNNNQQGIHSTALIAATSSGAIHHQIQHHQPQSQAQLIQVSEALYEQAVKSGCDVGETVAVKSRGNSNNSSITTTTPPNNNNMILSTTEMINQQQVYKIVTADGTTGNMIIDTLGNVTTTSGAQVASVGGPGAGASVVVNNATAAVNAPSGTGASKMLLGNLTVLSKHHHHHPVTAVSALSTPTMNSITSTTTAPVQQQSQHPQTINFVNAKNLPYLTSAASSLTPSSGTTTYASVAAAANGSKQKFALTSSAYKSGSNSNKHQPTASSTAFLLQQQHQKHGTSTTGAVAAITTRPVQMVTRVQTLLQPASSATLQQQTHQPQILLQQHPQAKHMLANKLGSGAGGAAGTVISGGNNFKKSTLKMAATNKQLSTAVAAATVQQHAVAGAAANLGVKTTFLPQHHQQQPQQHFQTAAAVGKAKTSKLVKQYNNAINNSASSLGTYTINHQKFSGPVAQLQNAACTTKVSKLSNKYILQQPQQLQGQQSQQQQHIVSLPHGTHLQHKGVLPTSSGATTTHHFNSNASNITAVSGGATTTTIYQHLTSNSNATIAAAAASGTIKFVNAHGTVIQQHPGSGAQTLQTLQNTSSAAVTTTTTTTPTVATIAPVAPSSSSAASVTLSAAAAATTSSTLFADDIVIVNGTQMTDELSARILQSMSQKSYTNSQQRYQQQQQKISNMLPPQTAATHHHQQQQISNILLASKDYQLYSPASSSAVTTGAVSAANVAVCQQQQQTTLLSPSITAATTCLPTFIQQQHNANASSSNSVVSSYAALGANAAMGGAVAVPVSPVSITYMAAPSTGTAAAITTGNSGRQAQSAPGSRSHSLERKYAETTMTRKGTDIYKLNSSNSGIASAVRNSTSAAMSGVSLTAPTEQQSYLQVQQLQQQQQPHTQVIHLQTLKSAATSYATTAAAAALPMSATAIVGGSIASNNSNAGSLNNSNANDEDIIGEEIRPVPVMTQDIRLQVLHAVLQDHTYANAMPTRLPSDFNVQHMMLPTTMTVAANSSLLTSVGSGSNVAQYVTSLAPSATAAGTAATMVTSQQQQQQWSLSGFSTTVTAMPNNQQATPQQQSVNSSYTTLYGQIPSLQQQDDDAHSAISSGSRNALGDIDPGEETETAPEAEAEDDSITRCICDLTHDDGYMICCDKCSTWQHVDCMGIDRSNIPDEYLCELCQPRPVSKTRARQIQMQKRRDQAQAVITVPAITNASLVGMSNVPASVGLLSKDSIMTLQPLQQRTLSGSVSGGSEGALHTLSNAALGLSSSGPPYLSNSSYTTKKSKILRKTKDSPAAGSGLTPTGRKSKKADKLAAAAAAAASGQSLTGKPLRKEPRKNAKRKSKASAMAVGTLAGSETTSGSSGPGANTAAGKHAANLRHWIEKYELAVTNHYSPELRARLQAITKQPSLLQSIINTENKALKDCGNLDNRATTVPHAGGKILISNLDIGPNFPIFELRGKFMLMSQYRTQNATVNMNSPPPTNYQLIASHKAHKTPGPFIFFYQLPGAEVPMQTMNPDGTYPPQPPQPAYLKGPEICVDTRTYGNEARFVRRSCRPNAEIQHLFEKGTIHLFLVSLTTIRASTEITIRHEPHDLAAVESRKSSALIVKPTSTACACGLANDCLFGPPLPKFTPGASKPGRKSAAQLRSDKKAYQSLGPGAAQQALTAGSLPDGTGASASMATMAGSKKKTAQSTLNRNRSTSSSGDSNLGSAGAAVSTGLISPNITQMHLGGNVVVGSSGSGIGIVTTPSHAVNSSSSQKSTLPPNNIVVPNNVLALTACGNSSSMHDSGICTSSSSPSVSIPSPTPQHMHSPTQQQQQQPPPHLQQQTTVLQRTLVMQQQQPQPQQLPSAQLQQQPQPQQRPSAQQQQQVLAALPASMLLSSQQIQEQPLAVMAAAAATQMQINIVEDGSAAQKPTAANVASNMRQRHISESSSVLQQQSQVQKPEANSVEAAAAATLQSLNSVGQQSPNSSMSKEQQELPEYSPPENRPQKQPEQQQQQQQQQLKSNNNDVVKEQTSSNEVKQQQQPQPQRNSSTAPSSSSTATTSTPVKATPQKQPHAGGTGSTRKAPGSGAKHARHTSVSESATTKSNSSEQAPTSSHADSGAANEATATPTAAPAAAATSTPKEKPKLSREDRKMEAILRAIEKMERTQQRKKEPKPVKTIAKRRQNEAAAKRAGAEANSSGELDGARAPASAMKRATHVTRKKKRKSSKSYGNTLAMQRKRHKSRISSNDSEADGDDCGGDGDGSTTLLSESEGAPYSPKITAKANSADCKPASQAAGLLMKLAPHSGEASTGGDDAACFKSPQKGGANSTANVAASNSDTTVSPPETPPAPVSSACLLIEAAVAPLDAFVGGGGSGCNTEFKYPSKAKTKKSLMSHWLHQSETESDAVPSEQGTKTNVPGDDAGTGLGLHSLLKAAMCDYKQQQQQQQSNAEERMPPNLSVAAMKVEEFIFQTERSSSPMNLTSQQQQQQHQLTAPFYTLSDGSVAMAGLNEQQLPATALLAEMNQGTSSAVRNLQLPLQQVSTCINNSSVKKRWLRQAISEETDDCCNTPSAGASPSSCLASAGMSGSVPNGFTTPLKKRRLVINSKDEPQTADDDGDCGGGDGPTSTTPTKTASASGLDATPTDEQSDWAQTEETDVGVFKSEADDLADDFGEEVGHAGELPEAADTNQGQRESHESASHTTRTKAASKRFEYEASSSVDDVKPPLRLKAETADRAELDYKTVFGPLPPPTNDQDDDVDIMRSPSPGPKIVAEDNLVKIEPEDVSGSEDVKIDVEREESLANDNFEEMMSKKGAAEKESEEKEELVKPESEATSRSQQRIKTEVPDATKKSSKTTMTITTTTTTTGASSSAMKPKYEQGENEKAETKFKIKTAVEPPTPQRVLKAHSSEDEDPAEPLEKKPKLTKTVTADADFFDVDEPPPKCELELLGLCGLHIKREASTPPANSTAGSLFNRQRLSDDDLQDRLTLFHEENIMLLQARNKQQSLESLLLDTTKSVAIEREGGATRAETPDYNKFELDTVKPSSPSSPLHPFSYVEAMASSSSTGRSTSGSRSKHANKSNSSGSYRKSRDRDRKRRRSRSRDSRRRSRERRPRSGSREHRSSYRSYERNRSRDRSSYDYAHEHMRDRSYERNRSRERSSYDYPRDHSRERTGTGGYYGNSSSSHNSYSGHSSGHSSTSTTMSSQHSSYSTSGKKSGSAWNSSSKSSKKQSNTTSEPFGGVASASKCDKNSTRYRSTSTSSTTSGGPALTGSSNIQIATTPLSSNRKRLNFDQLEQGASCSNKYGRCEGDETMPVKRRSYDGGEGSQQQYNAQRSLSSSSLGSSSTSDVCTTEMVYSIPVIGAGSATPAMVPIAVATPPMDSGACGPQLPAAASYPVAPAPVAPPTAMQQIVREHPTIPHFNNPLSAIPPPPPLPPPPPPSSATTPTQSQTTTPASALGKSNALQQPTTSEHCPSSAVNAVSTNSSNVVLPMNVNLPFYNTVYGKLLDNIAPPTTQTVTPMPTAPTTQIGDTTGSSSSVETTPTTPKQNVDDTAHADSINCIGSSGISANSFETKTKDYHNCSLTGYVPHSALFGLGGTAKTGSSGGSGIINSGGVVGLSVAGYQTDAASTSSSLGTSCSGIEKRTSSSASSSSSSSASAIQIGKISMLTKTASHDPRLNPILSAPEPPPVPKRKLSINEYRRRMKQSSSSTSSTESASNSSATTPTTPDPSTTHVPGSVDDGTSATLSRCTLNSPDRFLASNRYRSGFHAKAVEKATSNAPNSQFSSSKCDSSNLDGDLYAGIDSPPPPPPPLAPLKRSSVDDDSKKGGQFNAAPTLLEKQQEKLCERLKSLKSQQSVLKSNQIGNYEFNTSNHSSCSLNSNNSSFLLNRSSFQQQKSASLNNDLLDNCLEAISSTSTSLESSRDSSPERMTTTKSSDENKITKKITTSATTTKPTRSEQLLHEQENDHHKTNNQQQQQKQENYNVRSTVHSTTAASTTTTKMTDSKSSINCQPNSPKEN